MHAPLPRHIDVLKSDAFFAFRQQDYDRMSTSLVSAWAAACEWGDSIVCARIAHAAADLFRRADRLEASLEMAKAAVEHKRAEGTIDIFLGNYLAFLGQLLGRMGRAAEGIPYGEQAVGVYIELYGSDYRETRMVIGQLARLRWLVEQSTVEA